jgi:twitching motility protein PilT
LSDTIRYIVSQRLVPKSNGGRLLITEVLGSSLRTRETIRYGESEGKTFREIIDAATTFGWHSFDHCVLKAFEANEITEESAILYCTDKGRVRRDLDLLNKRIGRPEQDSPSALKLQVTPQVPKQFSSPGEATESTEAPPATNRRTIQPRSQPK